MEMPSEDQVKTAIACSFPDAWVMCAQDSIIGLRHSGRGRAGQGNHPRTMRHSNRAIVNPLTPALHHCIADSIYSQLDVVVSANTQDWRDLAERTDQIN
jgi:hypothetical protein